MTKLAVGSLLMVVACTAPAPATLTTTVTDSAGVHLITLDRPLAEVALGKAGAPNDTARRLFVVDSMTHPVAVAFLVSGDVAIVERPESQVIIVDSAGKPRTTLGRPGDGPGEFRLPAGIAALGNHLVVLQSRPSNTLTLFSDGATPRTSLPPIPGDWAGWFWHRPDIGLEFPSQSAPELWSRRLRALDDSTFLVYVGPTEEDTSAAAVAHLLRFDRTLSLRDTFATVPATRHTRRPADDPRGAPQPFQSVWAARTVWAADRGMTAVAWSGRAGVDLLDADRRQVAQVRWPTAAAPVTAEDRNALGRNIVRVTLAASPGAAEMKAQMTDDAIEGMMEQFLATFEFAATHPELVSLFLDDRCLWIAGFDPADDADGTSHEWLVIDLAAPGTPPKVVTIGAQSERVVALSRGKAATIRLDTDGMRRVTVYALPGCRG